MKNIHPKQIPTKLCIIRAELWETGTTAVELLMNCLLSEPNSSKQKNNIIAAAFLFERISCFVYRGKDGSYRKPPVKKYYREIFKNYAETPEEVFIRTEKIWGFSRKGRTYPQTDMANGESDMSDDCMSFRAGVRKRICLCD